MARRFIVMLTLATLLVPLMSSGMESNGADADSTREPRWWASNAGDATVPFPYVNEPIGSWVYDEVQRQVTQGNLSEIHFNSRPFSRALIAARVAQALAEGKRSLGLMRLAREVAWEARMMGLDLPFQDTRPMITLGPRESQVKFNGLASAGGTFEKGEDPDFENQSILGFRGMYWHPKGFSVFGDFIVTEVPNAPAFGDPIFENTDIQFNTPRYGLSWHAKFFEAWFARENLQWGPGRRGGLIAGGGAEPYAQLGYRIHLGSFLTATAVHGWLAQAERQFVAYHRVEVKFSQKLRWGIMEGVRYDATAPEPLYMINVVPYSAVERLLSADGSDLARAKRDSLFRSNYILSTDLYWRAFPSTALYTELMVDDIMRDNGLFDPEPEPGVPVRIGYQAGVQYIHEKARRLTLQAEYTRIYNYTYSTWYNRNLYHRDEPLGYPLGPDVSELNFWADLDLDLNWTLSGRLFRQRLGEGNLGGAWCPSNIDPADFGADCQTIGPASGSTFAGTVERRLGLSMGATFAPRDNLRFELEGGFVRVDNQDHVEENDDTHATARGLAAFRW